MAQLKTRQRKRVRVNRTEDITRHKREQTSTNHVQLDTLVDGISQSMKKIAKLEADMKEDMEKLEALMQSIKIRSWQSRLGKAAMVTPPTRAANSIDVEKFALLVDQDDFNESISVTMTAAKKVLAGKDLEKCTIKGRTKQKPDELKVTPNP